MPNNTYFEYKDSSTQKSNAFGIVTVMDVKVYKEFPVVDGGETPSAYLARIEGSTAGGTLLAVIDHMQVATLSTDGPSIEITGGKFNNKLIKYGKTARCEMTDALGQADVLVHLGGAEMDAQGNISITDKFGAPVTMVGETFIVDAKSGKHIPVKLVLYKFLPDSTPSFAFDSGNAATFDLNGDLLAVEGLNLGSGSSTPTLPWDDCIGASGVFFSMIPYGCALSE